jgi:hypothetical protein
VRCGDAGRESNRHGNCLPRAVTWRQLSQRQLSVKGKPWSRVPQYGRLSSRPTPTKVDYQVACGGLKSIIKSPAAPYCRLSGRLRRPTVDCQVACGALQSILRSPAAPYSRLSGRLRRPIVDFRVACGGLESTTGILVKCKQVTCMSSAVSGQVHVPATGRLSRLIKSRSHGLVSRICNESSPVYISQDDQIVHLCALLGHLYLYP